MENKFYTTEPNFINVSENKFFKFLHTYPRKLEEDFYMDSYTWNDFELANRWPYSVVAICNTGLDSEVEVREFRIMSNYKEVFNSKTGYRED